MSADSPIDPALLQFTLGLGTGAADVYESRELSLYNSGQAAAPADGILNRPSLPPTASTEEIEDELVYLAIVMASFDASAVNYAERFATFRAQEEDLQSRLNSAASVRYR